MSKLNPNREDLWQKPRRQVDGNDAVWYVNQVVGKDPLNDAMKKLSHNAKLSKVYTNHCIRATVMGIFDEHEFASRHIMFFSGHKSESSIKQYARNIPTKTKRAMSKSLAMELNSEAVPAKKAKEDTKQKEKVAETISVPKENPQASNVVMIEDVQVHQKENIIPDDFQLQAEDDEYINDENLIQVLEKIEKENEHLFPPQQQIQPQMPPILQQAQANPALNIQNVSNVSNKNAQPLMYFANSTVTINYNYVNPKQI